MAASRLRGFAPFPSLSPSSTATTSPSRRLCLLQSPCRCPPRPAQALRTFASAGEQDTSDAGDKRADTTPSSFSGLSAEELEQKFGKRSRERKEKPTKAPDPKPAPKDWESMTIAEKAWDLYISEKGALFWLNKIAYAAIFAVVGGWIAFRFVGPALNLYHLESPLLPPDEVFSGTK